MLTAFKTSEQGSQVAKPTRTRVITVDLAGTLESQTDTLVAYYETTDLGMMIQHESSMLLGFNVWTV
jgi:hypothetical protein